MAKLHQVSHRFVDRVPSPLEDAVVYVSIEFGTVIHKCCCGCGDKVVTPLTPVDWTVAYDGQTISLYPSVGRWDAACKSHYWIRNDRVIWSDSWSRSKIDTLKGSEAGIREVYFGIEQEVPRPQRDSDMSNQGPSDKGSLRGRDASDPNPAPTKGDIGRGGLFARLRMWWQRRHSP